MAGCLSADGIASHRAAGTLWRLPEVQPRLEITIPRARRAAPKGFEIHRTCPLERVDLGHRIGFEAQGYEHHSTLAAFARDQARNLQLFGEGWFIVPITEVELQDPVDPVTLMARIIARAEVSRLPVRP